MRGKIAVIDYGLGNVHSVSCALSFLGYKNQVTREHAQIRAADALLLPGVGAFGQAMLNLKTFNLLDVLSEEVCIRKKPILGICLGMQILGNCSQESEGVPGLGWIDFNVEAIPDSLLVKVPHVGWNTLRVSNRHPFFSGMEAEPHFFFDHGYHANAPECFIVASCEYGMNLASVVVRENITGVQFHPEKSQRNGLKLFRNYFNSIGV
jgi:glutamine amidotransferase